MPELFKEHVLEKDEDLGEPTYLLKLLSMQEV